MANAKIQARLDEQTRCTPKRLGHVFVELLDYKHQRGTLQFTLNGYLERTCTFDVDIQTIKSIFRWLEDILSSPYTDDHEFLFLDKCTERTLRLGYCPSNSPGTYHEEEVGDAFPELSMMDCGLFYVYDIEADEILKTTFVRYEDFVRDIYTRIKLCRCLRASSKIIESHFLEKEDISYEYKGIVCKGTVEGWDLRYYGRFFDADGEEIGGVMAAGYESGFKWHARRVIDNILASREYRRRNEEWKKSNDSESVGCVFHILSEKFRQRIVDGKYDVSLNGKVPGGDYEVPLPYVTKAWDYLLKDTLCNNEWRVEDDPDDYPRAERTREQAIAQNERMKAIWKEFFDIDVDALDVDFSQFNMHMTPNVDLDTEYIHFMDVPDGIEEWILDGIMFPSGASAFDSVSSLMEFAAYTGVQRETWEE